MYELTPTEEQLMRRITEKYYMQPAINLITTKINDNSKNISIKQKWKNIFDELYSILINTKSEVEKLLQERKQQGKIRDISQALKSIAGNAFSNLVIYTFLKNKEIGNIRSDIFITNRLSEVKGFDKIATIKIGSEIQKPDVDLVIYTKNKKGEVKRCVILSLKTSLRERAGQTYKWKLLLEIATTQNPIKDKYNIEYDTQEMPFVCFATVNFYNEINNPQHRGMFKFFDKSFIGKPIKTEFIEPLSNLINFINENL